MGVMQRQVFRSFEYLHHRFIVVDLHDAAQFFLPSFRHDFHDFIIGRAANPFQHDEGAVDGTQA